MCLVDEGALLCCAISSVQYMHHRNIYSYNTLYITIEKYSSYFNEIYYKIYYKAVIFYQLTEFFVGLILVVV